MTPKRLAEITERYARLKIAVIGDFCLDRYLEIDPVRTELSIETGLPVFNVTRIRGQPGGAGTILNNLSALGVGEIQPVGFGGEDGEGWELQRALAARRGVNLARFLTTSFRQTFTYTKPLICREGRPPEELSRIDIKNWSPTGPEVREQLVARARAAWRECDASILLDQVDRAETGVVVPEVLNALREDSLARSRPIIGDSRQGLRGWPPIIFKMNAAELAKMVGQTVSEDLEAVKGQATELAQRNQTPVFVTLAERGMVGASPAEPVTHVPAFPVRGPIDIVGAGDAVTANLTAALASGATLREAMELAMAGASVVIHQLGTTGTADLAQLRERLLGS